MLLKSFGTRVTEKGKEYVRNEALGQKAKQDENFNVCAKTLVDLFTEKLAFHCYSRSFSFNKKN